VIRAAKRSDLNRLVELGMEFLQGHYIPGGFNRESLEASFTGWLEEPDHPARILVYEDDQGVIVGSIGYVADYMYWNSSVMGSKELFWWVSQSARGAGVGASLLAAYGAELDSRGITVGFMTTLADSTGSARRILGRHGWVEAETNFLRLR
jgi:GNAT superfamily N-acetyltransferase